MAILLTADDFMCIKNIISYFKSARIQSPLLALKQLRSDGAISFCLNHDELFPERFMTYSDCNHDSWKTLQTIKPQSLSLSLHELNEHHLGYSEQKHHFISKYSHLLKGSKDGLQITNTNYLEVLTM